MQQLDSVVLTPQRRISNPKGDILHTMKSTSPGFDGFGEAYCSIIHQGIIKGWKRHNEAILNLVVLVGSVKFVVYGSPNSDLLNGKYYEATLGESNHARLTIQPGLWVAFQGIGSDLNMVLNISNYEHDPEEADNLDLSEIQYDW